MGRLRPPGGLEPGRPEAPGFGRERVKDLRAAYRLLFGPEGTFQERLDDVARVFDHNEDVREIVDFIRADANRPLCLPTLD